MIPSWTHALRYPSLHAAGLTMLTALACQGTAAVAPQKTHKLLGAQPPDLTPARQDIRISVTSAPFELAQRPLEEAKGEASHLKDLVQITSVGRSGDARFGLAGRRLYFSSLRSPATAERLYYVDMESRRELLLKKVQGAATGACESNLGLVFAGRDGTRERFGLMLLGEGAAAAKPVESAVQLKNPFDATLARGSGEIFVSAGPAGQRRLYVLDADLGHARRLLETNGSDSSPSPTPDGRRIAFSRKLPSGETRIMLLDRDRRQLQAVAGLPASNQHPALHPTAPLVVFASSYFGERDIDLVMVSLDDGSVTRLTYHPGFDSLPDFDADGRKLSFTSSRQGGVPQVFVARFEP